MTKFEKVPFRMTVSNPYPDSTAAIVDFRFDTGLFLMRPKYAVRRYEMSEDADYVLARDFTVSYRLEGEDAFRSITVPAGMLTDLASVPRLFRGFVGRVGPHLEAAIVHDYLYLAWQLIEGHGAREADRNFADRLMLAGMKESGVHWFHLNGIFKSISLAGAQLYRSENVEPFVDMSAPEFQG